MEKVKRVIAIILTAVMIVILLPVNSMSSKAVDYSFSGIAHVQTYGNRTGQWDGKTLTLGTTGQGKRLESVTINFNNQTGYEGSIIYRVHRQTYGWTDWVHSGNAAGTVGQGKRLEALQLKLTGELAKHYSIRYRVHIQTYGWNQGWQYDGALAGTTGEAKRLEALEIQLVPQNTNSLNVVYRVHRQTYGWETNWSTSGNVSGTTGQAKRLEGITLALTGNTYSGGITYRTHVQSYGWMNWVTDGAVSGTYGEAKRLEAIQIKLTGEIANYYDIYYRVHAQTYGWLGWAKNGQASGTEGLAKRLEAIQIVLVKKNAGVPSSTYNGVTQTRSQSCVSKNAITSIYVYGTTLTVGQSAALQCNVHPSNASKEGLLWESSDPSVASVDNDGRVTAIGKGKTQITVTASNGIKNSTTVTVKNPEGSIRSIYLYSHHMYVGETYDMKKSLDVYPENASKDGLQWSVDNTEIATIDQNGKLTGISNGDVTVTVTAPNGKSDFTTVTVGLPTGAIKTISLYAPTGNLFVGDTYDLGAYMTISPSYANKTNLRWASDNESAISVDGNGMVTAKAEGTATITVVTQYNVKASVKVTAVRCRTESIKLEDQNMIAGESVDLASLMVLKPEKADKTDFKWNSDNESVAKVNNVGFVQTVNPGIAIITVTDSNGVKGTATITVHDTSYVRVDNISLSDTFKTMYPGDVNLLQVSFSPKNASNKNVIWESSDASVVSVNAGVITAKRTGKATITAKSENNKVAECTITVKDGITRFGESWIVDGQWEIKVNSIIRHTTCNSYDSKKGDVIIVEYTYKNIGYDGDLYVFSNRMSICDQDGELGSAYSCTHDIAPKTCAIGTKCTASQAFVLPYNSSSVELMFELSTSYTTGSNTRMKQTFKLPIGKQQSISLNVTEKDIAEGDSYTLTATTPSGTGASWVSSDSDVATVNALGVVTAKKKGTAIITAFIDGAKAYCIIHVKDESEVPVDLKLDKQSLTLVDKDIFKDYSTKDQLTATANTSKEIIWKSLNEEIATVSQDGKVTAVSPGETRIVASVRGEEQSCNVVVLDATTIPVSLSFDEASVNIEKNKTTQLTVQTNSKQNIVWKSEDESVATVSETGKVTGVNYGSTVITASIGETQAVCKVEVGGLEILNGEETVCPLGGTLQLRTASSSKNTINWKSNRTSVVTVDENGLVTGKGLGYALVTATVDGYETDCLIRVNSLQVECSSPLNTSISVVTLTVKNISDKEVMFDPTQCGVLTDGTTSTSNRVYKINGSVSYCSIEPGETATLTLSMSVYGTAYIILGKKSKIVLGGLYDGNSYGGILNVDDDSYLENLK